jgi:hypothetical protein
MKKMFFLSLFVVSLSLIVGCATPGPMGIIVTKIKTPVGLNDAGKLNLKNAPRTGKAMCWSALGLFAGGNNTIQAAAKNGKIKKVWNADYTVNNWFGFYATYTVTVYGE